MIEVRQTNEPLKTIDEIKEFLKKHKDIVHFQIMTSADLDLMEKQNKTHLFVPVQDAAKSNK